MAIMTASGASGIEGSHFILAMLDFFRKQTGSVQHVTWVRVTAACVGWREVFLVLPVMNVRMICAWQSPFGNAEFIVVKSLSGSTVCKN